MINYHGLGDLFQTEEFKKEAGSCSTMEDFQEAFKKHGFDMTLDEVVEVISSIAEKKQKLDNGEISEEDLENVAGGIVLTGTVAVLACIGVGALCIGGAAITAYNAYHALRWANKGK